MLEKTDDNHQLAERIYVGAKDVAVYCITIGLWGFGDVTVA
jgi:hypothetical protein